MYVQRDAAIISRNISSVIKEIEIIIIFFFLT